MEKFAGLRVIIADDLLEPGISVSSMIGNSMNSSLLELETEKGGSVNVDEHLGQTKQEQRKRRKKKSKNSQAHPDSENTENELEAKSDLHPKALDSKDDACGEDTTAAGATSKSRARKLRRQRQKQRHANPEETTIVQVVSSSENQVSLPVNVPRQNGQATSVESGVSSFSVIGENISHTCPSIENQTMVAELNGEAPSAKSPVGLSPTPTCSDEAVVETIPQTPKADDTNGSASMAQDIVMPNVRGDVDYEKLAAGCSSSKRISASDTDGLVTRNLVDDLMADSKPLSAKVEADRLVSAYADDEKTADTEDCSCAACSVM